VVAQFQKQIEQSHLHNKTENSLAEKQLCFSASIFLLRGLKTFRVLNC